MKTIFFQTKKLSKNYDYVAPDGSEIRLLQSLSGGDLVHCTLPPYKLAKAVRHKSVEEIWHYFEGKGEAWRKQDDREEVITVELGLVLPYHLERASNLEMSVKRFCDY